MKARKCDLCRRTTSLPNVVGIEYKTQETSRPPSKPLSDTETLERAGRLRRPNYTCASIVELEKRALRNRKNGLWHVETNVRCVRIQHKHTYCVTLHLWAGPSRNTFESSSQSSSSSSLDCEQRRQKIFALASVWFVCCRRRSCDASNRMHSSNPSIWPRQTLPISLLVRLSRSLVVLFASTCLWLHLYAPASYNFYRRRRSEASRSVSSG